MIVKILNAKYTTIATIHFKRIISLATKDIWSFKKKAHNFRPLPHWVQFSINIGHLSVNATVIRCEMDTASGVSLKRNPFKLQMNDMKRSCHGGPYSILLVMILYFCQSVRQSDGLICQISGNAGVLRYVEQQMRRGNHQFLCVFDL